jgi:hypothetical protein
MHPKRAGCAHHHPKRAGCAQSIRKPAVVGATSVAIGVSSIDVVSFPGLWPQSQSAGESPVRSLPGRGGLYGRHVVSRFLPTQWRPCAHPCAHSSETPSARERLGVGSWRASKEQKKRRRKEAEGSLLALGVSSVHQPLSKNPDPVTPAQAGAQLSPWPLLSSDATSTAAATAGSRPAPG